MEEEKIKINTRDREQINNLRNNIRLLNDLNQEENLIGDLFSERILRNVKNKFWDVCDFDVLTNSFARNNKSKKHLEKATGKKIKKTKNNIKVEKISSLEELTLEKLKNESINYELEKKAHTL